MSQGKKKEIKDEKERKDNDSNIPWIFTVFKPGLNSKAVKLLAFTFVGIIISFLLLSFSAVQSGQMNVHVLIMSILGVLFILSWIWFMHSLKNSSLFQEMKNQTPSSSISANEKETKKQL